MRDQRTIAQKLDQLVANLVEARLVGQERLRQAMHRERLDRHVAIGIEVAVEMPAGRHAVDQLDTANLHQPVPGTVAQAGCFGVKHDFAHALLIRPFGP